MAQKTKKKALYLLGIIGITLFGSSVARHFEKTDSVFSVVNVAHADIPSSDGGTDGDSDGGGSDGGCSGCGDGTDAS